MWIPAQRGIVGNEMADVLAKQALKQNRISCKAALQRLYTNNLELNSKSEIEATIPINIITSWQKQWDEESKGRHLYKIR